MIAEFSEIDKYFVEKFLIVTTDNIGWKITQIAVAVVYEKIPEFVFFLRCKRTDKSVINIGRGIIDGGRLRNAHIGWQGRTLMQSRL